MTGLRWGAASDVGLLRSVNEDNVLTASPLFAAGGVAEHGFTHAVASGEPAAGSVLLWTRCLIPGGRAGEVTAEIPEGAVRSAVDGKPLQGYTAVVRANAPKAAAPATPTPVPAPVAAPTPAPTPNRLAARRAQNWARFLQLRRR